MNEAEVKALYKTLADGLTKLYQQSEVGGDDVKLNPARLHFYALGAYLADHGVLEALELCADYMNNHEEYPKYDPQELIAV